MALAKAATTDECEFPQSRACPQPERLLSPQSCHARCASRYEERKPFLSSCLCTTADFVKRSLYPNVDFFSGIVLRILGIPLSMFTCMFAVARSVGWVAQVCLCDARCNALRCSAASPHHPRHKNESNSQTRCWHNISKCLTTRISLLICADGDAVEGDVRHRNPAHQSPPPGTVYASAQSV